MSTETEDGVKPAAKPISRRSRERSVADVAREAFENRLIEGDRPKARRRPASK